MVRYTFLEPRTVRTDAVDGSIEVEADTITTKARHHKSLIAAKCEQILMADDKIRMTEIVNRLRIRSKDGITTVVTKPHISSPDNNVEAPLSFLENAGVNTSDLPRRMDDYKDAREYSTVVDTEPPGRIDEYENHREYSNHLTLWLDSRLAEIDKIGESTDKGESFNKDRLISLLECRDDNEVYETQVDEIRDDGCIIDKDNKEDEFDHLRQANIELMRLVNLLEAENGEYVQLLRLAVSK